VIEEQPQYSSPNLIMEYVVALAHSDSNSQEQCYDYINQINTLLQESISPSDIALIQKKKSTVFALFGDTEKAYSCLVEYQEYYEKMMTNQANQKSDIIAALYAIEAERYKNIILEQQLILKNEQIHKLQNDLRMKAHALLQQVQAVNVLRSDIITVFDELDKAEDILKNIRKKLNESPLLQRNWEKFLQAFEEISPNFSQRLLERYPDITKTEVRVLILVLSGLNNQEVSELLSVTERSVEKHRLNIRKKTGLKRDQSLHAAMMEIM
jgi:DNA-binding CsgD family transcriptional regulator